MVDEDNIGWAKSVAARVTQRRRIEHVLCRASRMRLTSLKWRIRVQNLNPSSKIRARCKRWRGKTHINFDVWVRIWWVRSWMVGCALSHWVPCFPNDVFILALCWFLTGTLGLWSGRCGLCGTMGALSGKTIFYPKDHPRNRLWMLRVYIYTYKIYV